MSCQKCFERNCDAMHVIDRESPQIERTLRPLPRAGLTHAEFDYERRHVLVSVREDRGALIVYDAATPQREMRPPMRKPSGKNDV